MKPGKIIALFFFILLFRIAYAIKVPPIVLGNFNHKFPNAKSVKWKKESKAEYEAEFSEKGKKISANYNNSGEWLETEKQISLSEIPKEVAAAVNRDYPFAVVVDADIIESSKHPVKYELLIKNKGKKKEVFYDSHGNRIE
jgi:hypothetical protein